MRKNKPSQVSPEKKTMHQWMERQRKKWEVTMRGKDKGVKGQKKRGSVGNKMEEGEWGGETGRRLKMGQPMGTKRGGREDQAGLKSDLAQQYNWGQTRND